MARLLLLLLLLISAECNGKYLREISSRNNTVLDYTMQVSLKLHPLQREIIWRTIHQQPTTYGMLGAPEVLQLGQNLMRLIRAKRVLDIGTFTGLSAVSWALAIPDDTGLVLTIDVYPNYYDSVTRRLIESHPQLSRKIRRHIGAAMQKLDSLVAADEIDKWDFAFIDADKINYPDYYDRVIQLLRPGGVLLVDNALWSGKVTRASRDRVTAAIDRMNRMAANDGRVNNFLLQIADGAHLIFKKYANDDVDDDIKLF